MNEAKRAAARRGELRVPLPVGLVSVQLHVTDPAAIGLARSIADVARRLGVKPDVIYAWAEWGHVPARRGPAGRLWIHFTPPSSKHASGESPAHTSSQPAPKPQPHNALKGSQYETRVPAMA